MVEKFNFYDIYGYLVPGGTLLALLWLPFAASVPKWPAVSAWAGAVVAAMSIAAAYVAGHLVQTLAVGAMPSSIKWEEKPKAGSSGSPKATSKVLRRKPSNIMLDYEGKAYVPRVPELVRESFQIDVSGSGSESLGEIKEIDKRREQAFLLCRAEIVEAKAATYVEQFEGMYTLMRGLSLSFYFGAAYTAGWALAPLRWGHSEAIASVAAILLAGWGICASFAAAPVGGRYVPQTRRGRLDTWAAISVGAALLAVGYCLALAGKSSLPQEVYLPIAFVALFCGVRCFTAYHSFAWDYAREVWHAFVVHRTPLPDQGPPSQALL